MGWRIIVYFIRLTYAAHLYYEKSPFCLPRLVLQSTWFYVHHRHYEWFQQAWVLHVQRWHYCYRLIPQVVSSFVDAAESRLVDVSRGTWWNLSQKELNDKYIFNDFRRLLGTVVTMVGRCDKFFQWFLLTYHKQN